MFGKITLMVTAACLLVTLSTCNKLTDDFAGKNGINGRLMFYDTLLGSAAPVPLANRTVKLAAYGSDTTNYIYSVQTDSSGYFSFQELNGKKYALFFEDTVGGLNAFAFDPGAPPGDDTVVLLAGLAYTNQGILHLIVTDQSGAPVAGVNLCIFNSALLFSADSCSGSVYQATTNTNGRANVFNAPLGTYYVRASGQFDSLLLTGTGGPDTVRAPNVNVVNITVVPVYQVGALLFQVIDANSQPVPNSSVYLFNNQQLFTASNGTDSGSIVQVRTDIYGNALVQGLHYGTYYCQAVDTLSTDTLGGKTLNIILSSPGVTDVPVIMH